MGVEMCDISAESGLLSVDIYGGGKDVFEVSPSKPSRYHLRVFHRIKIQKNDNRHSMFDVACFSRLL